MQHCFITVGSTTFDPLIEACLQESSQQALLALGITSVRIQAGRSPFALSHTTPHAQGLSIEVMDYLPDLHAELAQADLIIAHCGAGTVLECLRLKTKPILIVVANETLMDNHQVELRDALVKEDYCLAASPTSLPGVLQSLQNQRKRAFNNLPKSDGTSLNRIIAEELGKI
ncbi:glycosyltransferase family 1 protein [Protomyces lactucae-debilis]|uniref:UDP-N-acetylglucosamine transferase subunit ALG13 n=1 Tax=Protomyces lactucae-debilis TaxID=2754530 RepID=A0A1Y2FIR2_PROLT|nr:glycosyltransferase family 1 protein [Protomyces lactucae-debilis]ORY83840.1 glycosyltransferase family 1 protein [Protomyces lactucae-debilis]